MPLLINIIGAGQLGKTLGHLLAKQSSAQIGAICNTSAQSTANAIQFIGQGSYCPEISQLPEADLTFIITPDRMIEPTCVELCQNKSLKPGHIVLHCSGLLTSEILSSATTRGCYVASVHPMGSFANPELSVKQFPGTYCAIEGDDEAVLIVQALFSAIGSKIYTIDKEKKALYHAAGVFASNYLTIIAEQARLCLEAAGFDDPFAMELITQIMRSTVANLENTCSPQLALTGPLQRGDIATLAQHLQSLPSEDLKRLYSQLGKGAITLTTHSAEKKEKILETLCLDY